jgi:hypothetical protein
MLNSNVYGSRVAPPSFVSQGIIPGLYFLFLSSDTHHRLCLDSNLHFFLTVLCLLCHLQTACLACFCPLLISRYELLMVTTISIECWIADGKPVMEGDCLLTGDR